MSFSELPSHPCSTFLFISKEFACNGTVVEHSEYGEVIQLQGDQRKNICEFLIRIELAKKDQVKVHGFWLISQFNKYHTTQLFMLLQ